MMLKLKQVALAGTLMVLGLPVLAEDIALVIGNRAYDELPKVKQSVRVRESLFGLEQAGFRVFLGQDLTHLEQNRLAGEFYEALDGADRVVVVLSGHLVSTERDSWLLGVDANDPDMFSVGAAGLSVGAVLDATAQKPGAALVFIGHNKGGVATGYGLDAGAGDLDIPQGVTVIQGPMARLMQFLTRVALAPGQNLRSAIEQGLGDLVVDGFVPATTPFLPTVAAEPAEPTGTVQDADRAYWEAVQAIGTVEALLTYVERYPGGRHVFDANRLIGELRANPERQAQEGEKRLGLKREQRRQIQRNLSILGFNPRGVDGLFGRGSRAAIGAWQQSRGIEGYGYLTGNQIAALQSAADIRSQELEEEARRRQEEQDRQDATYWRQTGRNGTEDSLRAYLKRYPDGLYSEIAQGRVDQFDEARRAEAAVVERDYWDEVQLVGSAAGYRQYLQKYPRGAFAGTAKEQLAHLEGSARDDELIRRAKADEARVAGNGIARLLVEQKLQALGLKPGRVDGKFDDKTRRAVRKFQRARQIPVTGYVTQQTIVRLLAAR